jgi:hypothetical protein
MAGTKANPAPQMDPYPVERTEYPGGRQALGYRWAFNAFAILFLLTLIAGLVNYLGTVIKFRFG